MNTIDFARGLFLWLGARLNYSPTRDESGQSTLEWIIIVSLMSIAAVGLVAYIVVQINDAKTRVVTH